MIVGILSDSHGRVEWVRLAVEVLRRNGAEMLFHCGDLGGIEVLDELLEIPTRFVWGNMDRPDGATFAYCQTVGLPWPEAPLTVELDGKRIAACHGHEPHARSLLENGQFDYVFFGHSHERQDTRKGRTRVINPGALHRASVKTVATLDLASDTLTFFEVSTGRVVEL
ncbi:MAG: YfcE family phosphodiesterase [Phycisphaerae bacterium]|nr:YfcE family phosphodiesterase [Phycisphaerae bacterium]